MTGHLNIVTTPIGNYSDITIRALKSLNECDYIVCEEYKEASKLLRFFNISKELVSLNEHNEQESTREIFSDLAGGKKLSLISDCGSPLFSDPGGLLIRECIEAGIEIEFIGGADSLMASVVLSGFDISRFYFYGFLSPKSDIRIRELSEMKQADKVIVLMDAPYRLKSLLKDIEKVFPGRNVFVAFNITMNDERKFRGSAHDILEEIGDINLKGEFVILIDKNSSRENDQHN